MTIIQIVPCLPPKISGVGDYALLLAGELRRAHDIHTRFIICDPQADVPSELEGFTVTRIRERAAQTLSDLLAMVAEDGAPVFLHYVGYGYEKRGCPSWLAQGLEHWRAGSSKNRLATFFHELSVPRSRIWNSSFWNAGLQRKLTARLAQLSDSCFTNRAGSRDALGKMAPRHAGRIAVHPVFSNFGEPTGPAPLQSRPAQAVQFGGFNRRFKRQSEAIPLLIHACRQLEVERLVTIGAGVGDRRFGPLVVQSLDPVSSERASALLADSRVGFLDYFDGYLGKSGIFAAYCSHGLVPVLFSPNRSEADGLRAGHSFLVASDFDGPCPMARQQEIANAASVWYQGHNLSKMAAAIAAAMESRAIEAV